MEINEFLTNYYAWLKNKKLNKGMNIPEKMLVSNTLDKDGWSEWQLVESEISKFDLFKIEEIYKVKLPEVFKEYVMSKQFLDIQIDKYTLFGINTKKSLERILNFFAKNEISNGFIPIGQINDEDFIVLNIKTDEIIIFGYDMYDEKSKLSNSLTEFFSFLDSKLI